MEHRELDDRAEYEVQLTDEAVYGLAEVMPDVVYQRVSEMLSVLATFPRYGEEYDPYNEAARPPVPCRVLFVGRYGIYYTIDEERQKVTVLAIEDSRRDPRNRFKVVD